MRKTWHVRIPATTANLGAGFDSLGMALTIYNDFYFTADSQVDTITVTVSGKGEGTLSGDFSRNLIGRAMQYAATAKHTVLPSGGHLRAVNRIPLNRGLGSSSTAIVGGLLLGDAVTEGSLSTQELLDLATLMEGHPDNVAPAILGGLTVSIQENKRIFCQKLPFPEALQAVVVVPEAEVPTAAARKVLPKQVPHAAAVYNAGRVGFFWHLYGHNSMINYNTVCRTCCMCRIGYRLLPAGKRPYKPHWLPAPRARRLAVRAPR